MRLPFVATDGKGRLFAIDKFQTLTETTDDGGRPVTRRDRAVFRTKDGRHVTKLDSGKFVIRIDDRRISVTSDDPVAK